MHWQIGKGGGFHYHEAEARGEALPVTVFLGGPPALILAAIAPLPENVPELLLASLLLGEKLPMTQRAGHPHRLVADAEFALVGYGAAERAGPEGPFGDHYGYYSLAHDYPVFEVARVYRRRDAIFPATVVGKPRQEDFYIGDLLQELLSPLFPLVMPAVVDLWSYGETGFHSLAAAVVKERYGREAMASAFRILGEGQLVAHEVPARHRRAARPARLPRPPRARPRAQPVRDGPLRLREPRDGHARLHGPEGERRQQGRPARPRRPDPRPPARVPRRAARRARRAAAVFCPGALVVDGPAFAADRSFAERLAPDPAVAGWPLVVLADDAAAAAKDERSFLWHVFTRFEPAADVHGRHEVVRNHIAFTPPVVIDARTKPWMPQRRGARSRHRPPSSTGAGASTSRVADRQFSSPAAGLNRH